MGLLVQNNGGIMSSKIDIINGLQYAEQLVLHDYLTDKEFKKIVKRIKSDIIVHSSRNNLKVIDDLYNIVK